MTKRRTICVDPGRVCVYVAGYTQLYLATMYLQIVSNFLVFTAMQLHILTGLFLEVYTCVTTRLFTFGMRCYGGTCCITTDRCHLIKYFTLDLWLGHRWFKEWYEQMTGQFFRCFAIQKCIQKSTESIVVDVLEMGKWKTF